MPPPPMRSDSARAGSRRPSGVRPTAWRRPPASRRRPRRCASASGIAGTVEEHLAEVDLAGDVTQRPDVDARLVHVDQEVGDALALLDVGVRPGEQHRVVGGEAPRGPDLLAGDDPLLAVEHGPGGERREVGSGARLAEELAPDLFVAQDRRQVATPLLFGAVGEERGRGVVDPERVQPTEVVRLQLGVDLPRGARGSSPRPPYSTAHVAATSPERPNTGYQAS